MANVSGKEYIHFLSDLVGQMRSKGFKFQKSLKTSGWKVDLGIDWKAPVFVFELSCNHPRHTYKPHYSQEIKKYADLFK